MKRPIPTTVSTEDWRPVEIADLEDAAWRAMRHVGCASISAGPGSGKTEFLAQRAAFLLQTGTCPTPQKVLAISFKRESAANLRRRVSRRVPDQVRRFHSMTFDAFAKGIVDHFHALLPRPWALSTLDYEVALLGKKEVRALLAGISRKPPSPRSSSVLQNLDPGFFLPEVLGRWPLPIDPSVAPVEDADLAAWSWWSTNYRGQDQQLLDFTMINRLAELIVRSSPQVRRAIRVTYPFVFVDEFQDTTDAQMTLLKTVFGDSSTHVTAVGDRKQRIMKFAGALDAAMERFETEFDASRFELISNFRSSPDLVSAQHHVASVLDPDVAIAVSKARVEEGHTAVALWNFNDHTSQADYLARWIAEDISASGRAASDYAIIARQFIGKWYEEFEQAFSEAGVDLRNDDAKYESITLQDLLKHDLTRLLLGVLKLAVFSRGLPDVWTDIAELIGRVRGSDLDVSSERATSEHLRSVTQDLRAWLHANPPSTVDGETLVDQLLQVATEGELSSFVRGQQAGDQFMELVRAFITRVTEAIDAGDDWESVVRTFESADAVSLMTFHRSKGLEYHTVIAVGLDDEQWWSYQYGPEEGISTFFVGLSRAAHRMVFCTTKDARVMKIRELFALLKKMGVVEHDHASRGF